MKNISIPQKTFFIAALLIFSGVFFFMQGAYAQGSMVVQELIKMGKGFYESGHYEKAIHEFSKALLVEPYNEEALKCLEKMGVDGGVYGYQKTAVDHIYELSEEIAAYQNDLQALEAQKNAQQEYNAKLEQQKAYLKNMIAQKEEEKQNLSAESEEFRAVATMKLKENQDYISELEQGSRGKIVELVRLNTDLVEIKEELISDKNVIEGQAEELNGLKRDFEKYKKLNDEEARILTMKHEDELASLEKDRNDLGHEVFNVKDRHRQKMRQYQQAFVKKEAELKMEKSLSTIKSYRIAQQENRYSDLKEKLDVLRKQKIGLADEAEELRKQIRKLKQERTFRYASSSVDSKTDLKKQLVQRIRKQDADIMDLKTRLVEMLGQIDLLKEGPLEDGQRISELEQQVAGLEQEIAEKEKEMDFSLEQQDILEGRIEEYQERLDIVEGMITDKEERILFLEEQLGADVYPDEQGGAEDDGV